MKSLIFKGEFILYFNIFHKDIIFWEITRKAF